MEAALSGIKVLDFSRVLAGPYCTMLLADFGADIIKIENPDGGDDTRQWGPPWLDGQSAYYLSINRNKRSLALDLKHPRGIEIASRLAKRADVVVENFRTGSMAKYGLDYERLSKINPGIIYCSITGYGQTGPYSDQAGYDFVMQAEGGLMSITGPIEGPPYKTGVAIVDITAGLFASHAILAALHFREKTGFGQYIDVALLDAQVGWLANVAQNYLVSGKTPIRYGNAHANIVPYEVFQTVDGYLALAVGNDRQFQTLCQILGRKDLRADPHFGSNPGRVEYRAILIPELQAEFRKRNTDEWIRLLRERNIPAGPINDVDQALNHPQVLSRGMIQEVNRPGARPIKLVGPVSKLSLTPASIRSVPPRLGENSYDVLKNELNLSTTEIENLIKDCVIGISSTSKFQDS